MSGCQDFWDDVAPTAVRELFGHTVLSHTQSARFQQGATLRGVTLETYAFHREQGELWCGYHRQWEPQAEFGNCTVRGRVMPRQVCREGARRQSRAARERRRTRAEPAT